MEANIPEINPLQGDLENAIANLQSILNDNCLAAEKLMPLGNPEIKPLNKSVAQIEDSYDNLMKLMCSNMVPLQTIGAVAVSKCVFNARI